MLWSSAVGGVRDGSPVSELVRPGRGIKAAPHVQIVGVGTAGRGSVRARSLYPLRWRSSLTEQVRCAELECFCTPKSAVRPPAPARTTAESWGAVLEGSFVIPSRSRCAPHKKLISKGKRTLQQRFAIGIAASLHARRLRSLRSANFPAGSVSAALVVKHRGRQANPNSPGPREPARAAHPSCGLRASELSAAAGCRPTCGSLRNGPRRRVRPRASGTSG